MAVQRALLLIADIGGYTRFMNVHRVSLSHAQDIVARLLEAVIDAAQPDLKLSKLEGDAALFYATYKEDDKTKIDAITARIMDIHVAFAERRQELVDARLCNCDSCMQAGQLKLKFVSHLGEIAFQKVKRFKELAGVDVIVVHRLLKNSVPLSEYLLMTEPVLAHVEPQMRDQACEQHADLEGLGHTKTYYVDLSAMTVAPKPRRASFLRRIWELVKMNFRSFPFFVGARQPCQLFRNMEQATNGLLVAPSLPPMSGPASLGPSSVASANGASANGAPASGAAVIPSTNDTPKSPAIAE